MFIAICSLLLLTNCNGKAANEKVSSGWPSHTRPDRWKKPRVFHTTVDKRYSERFFVWRAPLTQIAGEKMLSPNKAYWFSVTEPDTMKPGPYKLQVDIYNERDYLVRLDVLDIYGNFKSHAEWINEKLLYARLWWGRVLGVDFIFDVEKEQIIYKENINDGNIPFIQWQQAKEKEINY